MVLHVLINSPLLVPRHRKMVAESSTAPNDRPTCALSVRHLRTGVHLRSPNCSHVRTRRRERWVETVLLMAYHI